MNRPTLLDSFREQWLPLDATPPPPRPARKRRPKPEPSPTPLDRFRAAWKTTAEMAGQSI